LDNAIPETSVTTAEMDRLEKEKPHWQECLCYCCEIR
jgi:hypothetical protein